MAEKKKTETVQKKLCIATPMYGGNAKSSYVASVSDLVYELAGRGWSVTQLHIGNESLITRARNSLVHNFMTKMEDYTGLMFIDADHGFIAKDVADMIESGKEIIGGIYPMKGINWEAVRKAAILGKKNLELYSGSFALNLLDEPQDFKTVEPFKVRDIGTGMMYIDRGVFEKMKPHMDTYVANGLGAEVAPGEVVTEYFKTIIDNESGQDILLSEDYFFCKKWRDLGGEVWAAPWVRVTHAGDYMFTGNFLYSLELRQYPDPES